MSIEGIKEYIQADSYDGKYYTNIERELLQLEILGKSYHLSKEEVLVSMVDRLSDLLGYKFDPITGKIQQTEEMALA